MESGGEHSPAPRAEKRAMPGGAPGNPFPYGRSFGYHTATVVCLVMAIFPTVLQLIFAVERVVTGIRSKRMIPLLTRIAFALPWWAYALVFGSAAALLVFKEVVLRSRRLRAAINLAGIVSGTCLLCAYVYAVFGLFLTLANQRYR